MSEEVSVHRLEIAKSQAHQAISLFISQKDYVSAITLAGASEEVLGKLAQRKSKTPILSSLEESLSKKSGGGLTPKHIRDNYLNKIKNSLKHFSETEDEYLKFQPEDEAISMILRAIGNYFLITDKATEEMHEFYRHLQKSRPDLFADNG